MDQRDPALVAAELVGERDHLAHAAGRRGEERGRPVEAGQAAQVEEDQRPDRDHVERQRRQARQPGERADQALGREGAAEHHAEQRDHRPAQAARHREAEPEQARRRGRGERAEQPGQRAVPAPRTGRRPSRPARGPGPPRMRYAGSGPSAALDRIAPSRQARAIALRSRRLRARYSGAARGPVAQPSANRKSFRMAARCDRRPGFFLLAARELLRAYPAAGGGLS